LGTVRQGLARRIVVRAAFARIGETGKGHVALTDYAFPNSRLVPTVRAFLNSHGNYAVKPCQGACQVSFSGVVFQREYVPLSVAFETHAYGNPPTFHNAKLKGIGYANATLGFFENTHKTAFRFVYLTVPISMPNVSRMPTCLSIQ